MRGITKAKIHTAFSKRITELRAGTAAQAKSFRAGLPRPYLRPSSLDERDLLDVPGLHDDAWDRNEININYDEATQSSQTPGTVGDTASLKLQMDYNATEERAFRARHASQIRCMTHMQGRLQGHSMESGVLDRVQTAATDFIKAGGVS
jgi:hypothetical protein